VLVRALLWWDAQPRSGTTALPLEIELIELLRRVRRMADADSVLTRLLAVHSGDLRLQTLRGVIAAARKDSARSEAVSAWLAARDWPISVWVREFGRARIAAVAGDRQRAITLLRSSSGSRLSSGARVAVTAERSGISGSRLAVDAALMSLIRQAAPQALKHSAEIRLFLEHRRHRIAA
jgi:hypothetical protein